MPTVEVRKSGEIRWYNGIGREIAIIIAESLSIKGISSLCVADVSVYVSDFNRCDYAPFPVEIIIDANDRPEREAKLHEIRQEIIKKIIARKIINQKFSVRLRLKKISFGISS